MAEDVLLQCPFQRAHKKKNLLSAFIAFRLCTRLFSIVIADTLFAAVLLLLPLLSLSYVFLYTVALVMITISYVL